MYWTFFPQDQDNENAHMAYILDTFQALVDTIIPRTPRLAQDYGVVQYYGALDAYIDQYLILSLQNLYYPMASFTIEILDAAAQIVNSEGYDSNPQNENISFSSSTPEKRLQAIELLQMASAFPANYPRIFSDNPDIILYIYGFINRAPMLGYYSEWFGYGDTRILPPDQRQLEYYPFSWQQIDYPGPSLGYHALRNTM